MNDTPGSQPTPAPGLPRLLDQLRLTARHRGHPESAVGAFVDWIRRFILFHGKRHPREMGATEVGSFLSHLAVQRHVASSTQNQALNALVFLYGQVLHLDLGQIGEIQRAKRPERLPVVLTRTEVQKVLDGMTGTCQLMARLLYGSGMRLMECVRYHDLHPRHGQTSVGLRSPWMLKAQLKLLNTSFSLNWFFSRRAF